MLAALRLFCCEPFTVAIGGRSVLSMTHAFWLNSCTLLDRLFFLPPVRLVAAAGSQHCLVAAAVLLRCRNGFTTLLRHRCAHVSQTQTWCWCSRGARTVLTADCWLRTGAGCVLHTGRMCARSVMRLLCPVARGPRTAWCPVCINLERQKVWWISTVHVAVPPYPAGYVHALLLYAPYPTNLWSCTAGMLSTILASAGHTPGHTGTHLA